MNRRVSLGRREVKRGEPWFDDGNIVLITQEDPTAFRLHRGVLARHSEVFSHMFELPQVLDSEAESFEGCQVVYIYDLPLELSNLFNAIYDSPNFTNQDADGFFYLAGILRLTTKYMIEQPRQSAIKYLTQTWSSTLEGHDSMVEIALNSQPVNGLTYPFVHPLHVLNLARETDINIVVPSALYFLSLYSLSDILSGDHPKLLLEHPSKPSSILAPSDILLYSLMYQHRLQILEDFIRDFCGKRIITPSCGPSSIDTCGKAFSRLVSQLRRSWSLRTGPLHFMLQTINRVSADSAICKRCRSDFARETSLLRQEVWDNLPSVVRLPSWDRIE
ncbi:hypothetical protein JR316_0006920 [Psilocybe cubensis]|uniref:Uncharacterized protein n=1 Tax=Psilocybe cubensis TaxID=181762 RepID=A0ACB8GY10_PSICU|nr:hypothetical protein JR316_0006920 [Psilocybe cubensis]KAH9480322.1 hypothetical protein JR316_0006920 [Psilocybe cubensis]